MLPVSIINQLPREQMEAILLHELCHIKRADFLHNIMQLLVETLFFYHPLAKWISRDVRVVREKCCDELVLKLKTNPLTYAKALTNIATIYNNDKMNHHSKSYLQIAATDGELFNRIKFLMLERQSKSSKTNILLSLFFIAIILFSFNSMWSNDESSHFALSTYKTETIQPLKQTNRPSYVMPNVNAMLENDQAMLAEQERIRKQEQKVARQRMIQAQFLAKKQIQQQEQQQPNNDIVSASGKETTNRKLDNQIKVKESSSNLVVEKPLISDSVAVEIDKVNQDSIVNNEKTNATKGNSYPKLIKRVNPVYSRKAQTFGIEGTVILSFNIDAKGRVKNIKVDKSSPLKLLDGSARKALHKWRFDKNSINKDNIHNRYQQIFSFYLNGSQVCNGSELGTHITSNTCEKVN